MTASVCACMMLRFSVLQAVDILFSLTCRCEFVFQGCLILQVPAEGAQKVLQILFDDVWKTSKKWTGESSVITITTMREQLFKKYIHYEGWKSKNVVQKHKKGGGRTKEEHRCESSSLVLG